ncbi:hypothetical protein HPP92_013714 [Vanilla planifolia]|uniref:Uncharacterized protein n=1 Tax=Vanilla planifolia TaxID=51239 RepID=A0A835QZK9_VANPL|nr:hypothetical protein HPP92_013714 [Vanilla planifolia]
MVSQKIEKALPPGIKYGPGWVGEYEPLPRPFLSLENCNKQHIGKTISDSRPATKDKVTELKSNAGQNPISTKKQHELKKQLICGIPRQASVPIESTSCRNSMEQKLSFLGADSTVPLRINGTGQEKHSNDSNNLNSGFSNPVNSANCSVASVRVKEESHSEETTERSHVVFCANGKTQRSAEKGLHRKKNHEKRESNIAKAFTKSSQQGVVNNPSSNGSNSNLPGIVLREGNDLQTKNQKELPTASFQTQNNILGMAIGGLSNGIRPNNHFAFSSSHQARVNYGLGLVNNRDQASMDPFRLVGFSSKVTNQENISSSDVNGMSYLERPIPIVSSLARENYGPATSNASKAWISAGTAVQWKSVDSKSSSGEPITSPPFCNNSTWKPTTSIQLNGDSVVRPGNLPIQVFDEASNVKNRGLVIFPQLITTDVSKHQSHPPWQLLSPQPRSKQRDNLPPDLNIGYQPPGSPVQQPSANLAMDSQQPDLALQL